MCLKTGFFSNGGEYINVLFLINIKMCEHSPDTLQPADRHVLRLESEVKREVKDYLVMEGTSHFEETASSVTMF